MEPSDNDLWFEAERRADREMPLPQQVPSNVGAPRVSLADVLREASEARKQKVAGYYGTMLALAQGRQREAATKAMLVPAAVGVVCLVLGYVSFRARLIAAGILLMGLTAVYAAFLIAKKDVGEAEAAMYGFVIAIAGLSGLVCAALGMMRILATSKGT